MIAVYDDEGWNIEIAPQIGDIIYADSSFYLVRITAPGELKVVTSGQAIDRSEQAGQQVLTVAAGPVRDFYLAANDRYTVASQTIGEITVNSYAPAELAAGSEMALTQAVQALQSFNEHFGPYPFTELDLAATPNLALGVEYPGLVVIRGELYEAGQDNRLLESVVAHEVAHQWFYNVVGNDQVDEPWVDEALAQHATLLYYLDVYGPGGAAAFRGSLERRWERLDKAEIPIGLPVRAYTVAEYSAIVYGRGPLFLEALAESMGQESFAAFLKDYYQHFRWNIATTAAFKELAESHCQCNLTPLFEKWVYETPPP
jgi:aminopeptidase N